MTENFKKLLFAEHLPYELTTTRWWRHRHTLHSDKKGYYAGLQPGKDDFNYQIGDGR